MYLSVITEVLKDPRDCDGCHVTSMEQLLHYAHGLWGVRNPGRAQEDSFYHFRTSGISGETSQLDDDLEG